jgi:hypothetical protein
MCCPSSDIKIISRRSTLHSIIIGNPILKEKKDKIREKKKRKKKMIFCLLFVLIVCLLLTLGVRTCTNKYIIRKLFSILTV